MVLLVGMVVVEITSVDLIQEQVTGGPGNGGVGTPAGENTGSGGGGCPGNHPQPISGGSGGSGIVIIAYPT